MVLLIYKIKNFKGSLKMEIFLSLSEVSFLGFAYFIDSSFIYY